jgi:vacuolar-type H+-ATPase subunit I/STV1
MEKNERLLNFLLKIDLNSYSKYQLLSLEKSITDFNIKTEKLKEIKELLRKPENERVEIEPIKKDLYLELPNLLEKEQSQFFTTNTKPKRELFARDPTEKSEIPIHENLMEAFEQKTAELLTRVKEFDSLMERDGAKRNDLQDDLDVTSDKISLGQKGIKNVNSGTWKTTLMIWASILCAFLIFTFMYLYMRLFNVKRWNDEL